jgi:IS1 family transposase
MGNRVPGLFYSVRPEESSLKAELEQNLLSPLIRNCSEAAGQIARHKLHSLVGQTLNYLQVALAAATQAKSSRQALREKLGEERGQFDLLRSELTLLSREWAANALDWSITQLQPTQAALQAKITTELRKQFRRWKLRLPPMLEAWREWLGVFLTRELTEVSHSQQAMFCSPLHRARQLLTRTLRAFHDRLAEHVKAALGVSLNRSHGDQYTYLGVDAKTKFIINFAVGKRDSVTTQEYIQDLRKRVKVPFQLTTDGFKSYPAEVYYAFLEEIHYAQLIKEYACPEEGMIGERRYSPPECIGAHTKIRCGTPSPDQISTSYVERTNLSVRLFNRRFTRLTLGYSKKLANLKHSVALLVAHFNFCRKHNAHGMTPAMAAGLADHTQILALAQGGKKAPEPPATR